MISPRTCQRTHPAPQLPVSATPLCTFTASAEWGARPLTKHSAPAAGSASSRDCGRPRIAMRGARRHEVMNDARWYRQFTSVSPVPSGSIEGRVNGARRCASSKAAGLPRVDIRTILPYSANAFGGTSLRACSTGSSCACVMRAPAADRVPTGPRGVCTYAYATSPRLHVQARVRHLTTPVCAGTRAPGSRSLQLCTAAAAPAGVPA